ncbi:hypothetical protein M3I54_22925 [Paraburkholderia sp. CNPSo 3274]|uniref:hypothetical protein n=1 Tax=Paraburkholderia sp. CNPSo 3274 TaxID=2940932 RepID=UPI0020B8C1B1|nr:hypothetical protein [Paraburkholderia sp. CNPSo 3274]MCP3709801.1 hypothetical protein [Paraburkholderia sp. CNPSo 3274]
MQQFEFPRPLACCAARFFALGSADFAQAFFQTLEHSLYVANLFVQSTLALTNQAFMVAGRVVLVPVVVASVVTPTFVNPLDLLPQLPEFARQAIL